MALPVVAANTPSPGHIAWQAFTIQYQGQSFGIPAGSTQHRWVWWRWNGGGANSVLEAGPDIPGNLTDDDLVILGNRAGIPVRIQSSSYIDGELLVNGSVLATALAADAIDGKTITGALLQTLADANRGIKLVGNTLRAWDNAGVERFLLDGATGELTARGVFTAGNAELRQGAVRFLNGSYANPGQVQSVAGGIALTPPHNGSVLNVPHIDISQLSGYLRGEWFLNGDLRADHLPRRVATGRQNVTVAAGQQVGNIAIAFPTDRFTTAPRVICSAVATSLWNASAHTTPTTAGVTLGVRSATNTNAGTGGVTVAVDWIAIQQD